MKNIILESCVEALEEAKCAEAAGAAQLEVCSRLDVEGLTPELSVLTKILDTVRIPCKVMINNRPGNYFYDVLDIKIMEESIKQLKLLNIAGVVFGANKINEKGFISLDMAVINRICKAADPLPVTIHKAIDICNNILDEITSLKTIPNVNYILTSGGKATAEEGIDMLKKMKDRAGMKINIIAAGKILSSNLEEIKTKTNLTYFHGRKIV